MGEPQVVERFKATAEHKQLVADMLAANTSRSEVADTFHVTKMTTYNWAPAVAVAEARQRRAENIAKGLAVLPERPARTRAKGTSNVVELRPAAVRDLSVLKQELAAVESQIGAQQPPAEKTPRKTLSRLTPEQCLHGADLLAANTPRAEVAKLLGIGYSTTFERITVAMASQAKAVRAERMAAGLEVLPEFVSTPKADKPDRPANPVKIKLLKIKLPRARLSEEDKAFNADRRSKIDAAMAARDKEVREQTRRLAQTNKSLAQLNAKMAALRAQMADLQTATTALETQKYTLERPIPAPDLSAFGAARMPYPAKIVETAVVAPAATPAAAPAPVLAVAPAIISRSAPVALVVVPPSSVPPAPSVQAPPASPPPRIAYTPSFETTNAAPVRKPPVAFPPITSRTITITDRTPTAKPADPDNTGNAHLRDEMAAIVAERTKNARERVESIQRNAARTAQIGNLDEATRKGAAAAVVPPKTMPKVNVVDLTDTHPVLPYDAEYAAVPLLAAAQSAFMRRPVAVPHGCDPTQLWNGFVAHNRVMRQAHLTAPDDSPLLDLLMHRFTLQRKLPDTVIKEDCEDRDDFIRNNQKERLPGLMREVFLLVSCKDKSVVGEMWQDDHDADRLGRRRHFVVAPTQKRIDPNRVQILTLGAQKFTALS